MGLFIPVSTNTGRICLDGSSHRIVPVRWPAYRYASAFISGIELLTTCDDFDDFPFYGNFGTSGVGGTWELERDLERIGGSKCLWGISLSGDDNPAPYTSTDGCGGSVIAGPDKTVIQLGWGWLPDIRKMQFSISIVSYATNGDTQGSAIFLDTQQFDPCYNFGSGVTFTNEFTDYHTIPGCTDPYPACLASGLRSKGGSIAISFHN
jgi:hypothetical protein